MLIAKLLTLAFASSASALPVVTLPWFGQVSFDGFVGYLGYMGDRVTEHRTIYQVLKDDKQYSRLVKAIGLSESVVDLLSDPCKNITFFAVPNSKLPPHHGDHGHDESLVPFLVDGLSDGGRNLGNLVQRVEELDQEPGSLDKDKRKEALARIIHKILAYHILPEAYGVADLAQNSTYATNLTLDDGSMDSQPLRLNVVSTSVPPSLKINIVVEVTKRNIKAKNGVIHQISYPLLPPPSIFQETFAVPDFFSVFTSAIQRVGLAGAIDRWKCSRDDGHNISFLGATATTAFVPTSGAFHRLPQKLRRYLFSPFGQKALKKLLEYHIVPNFVLHTDYLHNSTSSDVTESTHCFGDAVEIQYAIPVPPIDGDVEDLVLSRGIGPPLGLVYEYNVALPTLIRNHYIRVHVARYKMTLPFPSFPQYLTSFKVNGNHVAISDIPARNGALHVLTTILDPRKGCDRHVETEDGKASWEDWEEWFPQWAMEN